MTTRTRIRFSRRVLSSLPTRLSLTVASMLVTALVSQTAYGWDSAKLHEIGSYSTHTIFTRLSIGRLQNRYPELYKYKPSLIRGSNAELHEIKVDNKDFEKLRVAIGGSNEGLRHPDRLWHRARAAYKLGRKRGEDWTKKAYVYTGILLHMIQDMGVPSHGWGIYHQAPRVTTGGFELHRFDNFEALGADLNWKPDYGGFTRSDPKYTNPWQYYNLSRNWTRMDTRHWHGLNQPWNKKDRDKFSKTWTIASKRERTLFSTRQAWTLKVTEWALQSASIAFEKIRRDHRTTASDAPAPRPRTQSSAPAPRRPRTESSAPRPR